MPIVKDNIQTLWKSKSQLNAVVGHRGHFAVHQNLTALLGNAYFNSKVRILVKPLVGLCFEEYSVPFVGEMVGQIDRDYIVLLDFRQIARLTYFRYTAYHARE